MLDPQKNKRWHDGFLKVLDFGNIKLLDENKAELDSDFNQKHGAIQQGDTLEFERYLVEVRVLPISILIILKHTHFGGFQDSPTRAGSLLSVIPQSASLPGTCLLTSSLCWTGG